MKINDWLAPSISSNFHTYCSLSCNSVHVQRVSTNYKSSENKPRTTSCFHDVRRRSILAYFDSTWVVTDNASCVGEMREEKWLRRRQRTFRFSTDSSRLCIGDILSQISVTFKVQIGSTQRLTSINKLCSVNKFNLKINKNILQWTYIDIYIQCHWAVKTDLSY